MYFLYTVYACHFVRIHNVDPPACPVEAQRKPQVGGGQAHTPLWEGQHAPQLRKRKQQAHETHPGPKAAVKPHRGHPQTAWHRRSGRAAHASAAQWPWQRHRGFPWAVGIEASQCPVVTKWVLFQNVWHRVELQISKQPANPGDLTVLHTS